LAADNLILTAKIVFLELVMAADMYLLLAKIVYYKFIMAGDNLLIRRVIWPRTTRPKLLNPVATEILVIA